MIEAIIDSVLELTSSLIPYESGSTPFWVVLIACVATWVIVARVLMGLLKSDRGIAAALFALAVTLSFGLFAYGVVDVRIAPRFEGAWAKQYLATGVAGVVVLLVILLLCKRVFVVDGFAAVLIFAFASAAALGTYFAVEITLETLGKGSEQIKQREERSKKEIDSML